VESLSARSNTKIPILLNTGFILAERFTIEKHIGTGRKGSVYQAIDNSSGKHLAIKVINSTLLKTTLSKKSFLDEIAACQKITHSNLIPVHSLSLDDDYHFITMPLLMEGETLRDVMNKRKQDQQDFSIDEVTNIIRAVSKALTAAHQHTVHHDIKPDNIWVSKQNNYKVMDIGLASLQTPSQRAKTSVAMGTAAYISPEQLKGLKIIDDKADQYALAILAYELLTKRTPARSIEPIKNIRPDTPPLMANTILRGLSFRPESRFNTIADFYASFTNTYLKSLLRSFSFKAIISIAILFFVLKSINTDTSSTLPSISSKSIVTENKTVIKEDSPVSLAVEIIDSDKQQKIERAKLESNILQAKRIAAKHIQQWSSLTAKNNISNHPQVNAAHLLIAQAEKKLDEGERQSALQLYHRANETFEDGMMKAKADIKEQQTHADLAAAELKERLEAENRYQAKLISKEFAQKKHERLKVEQEKQLETERDLLTQIRLQKQQATLKHETRLKKLVGNMILIPTGSFEMGCLNELNCRDSEKPSHTVNLQSFKIGQTEVTWGQYKQCVDSGACPDNGSGLDDHPVSNVSYNDITQHYLPWLNSLTGEQFRLPSESEWEYAAKAGSTTKYSWGNSINCNNAHYNGGEDSNCYYKINGQLKGTVAVASYPANDFGLYDMHGNVWEWTQDCWNKNYSGAPEAGKAWGQGNCGQRVVRGGSWVISPINLRASYRNKSNLSERDNSRGFRLVQE